jgi:hypothetical protein
MLVSIGSNNWQCNLVANGWYSFLDFDAALSSDGKWLASFIMSAPFRYGYIISLETHETIQFSDQVMSPIHWSEK